MTRKYATEEERKAARREQKRKWYQANKDKMAEYDRRRYQANKEQVLERRAEYYQANKDKVAAQKAAYYQANKEQVLERRAEYYQANKDKIAAQKAAYRKANKEKIAAQQAEYKAEYNATPIGRANNLLCGYRANDKKYNRGECTLTAQWIVENIFSKPCHYCGESDWIKIGCDRIYNDKPHTEDNVVPCCAECNLKRGTMDYNKFVEIMRLNEKREEGIYLSQSRVLG